MLLFLHSPNVRHCSNKRAIRAHKNKHKISPGARREAFNISHFFLIRTESVSIFSFVIREIFRWANVNFASFRPTIQFVEKNCGNYQTKLNVLNDRSVEFIRISSITLMRWHIFNGVGVKFCD